MPVFDGVDKLNRAAADVCAVDFANFVTDAGPDVCGSTIQRIDTIIDRHVDNPLAVALIDDHVHQRRDNGLKLLSLYSLARWLDA